MRYDIKEAVSHESHEIGDEVVTFSFPAGVVDASDEDAALIEQYLVPAGLAEPVAESDDKNKSKANPSNDNDADADAPSE